MQHTNFEMWLEATGIYQETLTRVAKEIGKTPEFVINNPPVFDPFKSPTTKH